MVGGTKIHSCKKHNQRSSQSFFPIWSVLIWSNMSCKWTTVGTLWHFQAGLSFLLSAVWLKIQNVNSFKRNLTEFFFFFFTLKTLHFSQKLRAALCINSGFTYWLWTNVIWCMFKKNCNRAGQSHICPIEQPKSQSKFEFLNLSSLITPKWLIILVTPLDFLCIINNIIDIKKKFFRPKYT